MVKGAQPQGERRAYQARGGLPCPAFHLPKVNPDEGEMNWPGMQQEREGEEQIGANTAHSMVSSLHQTA